MGRLRLDTRTRSAVSHSVEGRCRLGRRGSSPESSRGLSALRGHPDELLILPGSLRSCFPAILLPRAARIQRGAEVKHRDQKVQPPRCDFGSGASARASTSAGACRTPAECSRLYLDARSVVIATGPGRVGGCKNLTAVASFVRPQLFTSSW